MPTIDPALINQALATQGSSYRVPTLAEAQANAAQFPALPIAGAESSLLEQAAGTQGLPTGEVSPAFSMVPPEQPQVVLPTEATPPPPPPPPAPAEQQLPSARGMGAGAGVGPRMGAAGGVANPVPGMLADATARRKEAEAAQRGYEAQGDLETARLQQAAEDVGAARAGTYEDVAKVQQRIADEGKLYQARLADDQDSYEKATARTEAEQRELSGFIGGYEPKDRRTTGKKMMSALAVGLSQMTDQNNLVAGLMQGMNVQTNNADQVSALIQRGIDRDIDMQRQMLDNKRTALAAKGTELGQAREKFGDRMDAMKLARAMKLDQAAQEMEALKSQGLSKEATALADQTIASLGAERANTLAQVSEQRLQQHYANEQRLKMAQAQQAQAAAAARARAQQPMSPERAMSLEKQALENAKLREELGGGGAPYGLRALGGQKPSQRATEKAQDLASNFSGVRSTVASIRAAARKGATLSPTERAVARMDLQSLKSQFNGTFGDGTAPNEAQLEAMDAVLLNPTEVNMANAERIYEHLDRRAVDLGNAKLRNYGYVMDNVDVRPE